MATSQLYELRKDSQPKSAEIDNKSETQDFKVTLLKNDTEWSDLFEKIEVRRFVVSKDSFRTPNRKWRKFENPLETQGW